MNSFRRRSVVPGKPDTTDVPWWHGTNYEVLDPISEDGGSAMLQATFTPSNGIRITIENDDIEHLAVFDFTEEQAKMIGAKLIEWSERGHG